eukprot:546283-Karenia_brevis.AAC.1
MREQAPTAPGTCAGLSGEDVGRPMQEHIHVHNTRGDGVGEDSMAPTAPVGVRRMLGGRCMRMEVRVITPVTSFACWCQSDDVLQ